MTEPTIKLLRALEDERRYVAVELHDGVAQTTQQLSLQAGICRKLLEHNKLDMLTGELAQLETRCQVASRQLREMIAQMRPPKVEPEAGPNAYFQQVIDDHLEQGGAPVEYTYQWSTEEGPGLTGLQWLGLARIVQEALLNVRKHAQASKVKLKAGEDEHNFYLIIADDGEGFDLAAVKARTADKGGAGLANLQVRAEAIGGRLTIATDTGGPGTEISVTWPK